MARVLMNLGEAMIDRMTKERTRGWLRKLRIDEISLVDKPANEHAKITILKKATTMTTDEILEQRLESRVADIEARKAEEAREAAIAKGLAALARETWKLGPEGELNKLADEHASKHNVNKARAMDAVLKTSKGAELYARFKTDHDEGSLGAVELADKAGAEARLDTLAQAVSAEMNVTKAAAMDSVLATPLGAALYEKTRGAAFTPIDPPPTEDAIAKKRAAESRLKAMAEAEVKKSGCSLGMGYFAACQTPEGNELYKLTKAA